LGKKIAMLKYVASMFAVVALISAAHGAEPANHATTLALFVSQDTFAVAYLDIAAIDLPKDRQSIFAPPMIQFLQSMPAELQAQLVIAEIADQFATRFRDAGGQGIYVLAGLSDIHLGGGPVLVATSQPGRNAADVAQFLGATVREMADNRSYANIPSIQKLDVQLKDGVVLAGMKSTVARYASSKPSPRSDLLDPLAKLTADGAIAAAVFCPGPDFRRVVRELWPELPGALAPLKGELADRWLRFEAAANHPSDSKFTLAVETSDADAAKTFVDLWQQIPAAVTQVGGNDKSVEQAKGWAQLLVSTLHPKADGKRVTIGMPTEADRVANLQKMLSAAINKANEASNRRERVQRFKEIALAMLNYESAKRRLPPAAIYDKERRPLLSWRVAILPYLDQDELYKQFHLDESWDSPHNRTLIEKMPGTYMDVGPRADQLNREGKTTYQIPVGPETSFHDKNGSSLRDIVDGTSQTISVVEVEPRRAVVWTKPEDFEVDLSHPRNGLERSDRSHIVTGFLDGHVLTIDLEKTSDAKLRAFFTRAGREVDEK
jgi:Protein of unknown function (DUF1559)